MLLCCLAQVQCLPPVAVPPIIVVSGSRRLPALVCRLAHLCATAAVTDFPLPPCILLRTHTLASGHCVVNARQGSRQPHSSPPDQAPLRLQTHGTLGSAIPFLCSPCRQVYTASHSSSTGGTLTAPLEALKTCMQHEPLRKNAKMAGYNPIITQKPKYLQRLAGTAPMQHPKDNEAVNRAA